MATPTISPEPAMDDNPAESTPKNMAEPSSPAPVAPLDPISERLRSLQLETKERRGGGGIRWGRLLTLLLLIGLGVGGYFGWEQYQKDLVAKAPSLEGIKFGERAGSGILLEVGGYVVPRTKVQISPQGAGMIVSLPIEEGQKVKKGDLLCKLDDSAAQAELLRAQATLVQQQASLDQLVNGPLPEEFLKAKASVESAGAQFELTRLEFERVSKLRDSNGISQSDYQKSEAAFINAQQQKIIAELNLKIIEKGTRPEQIAAAKAMVEQAKGAIKSSQVNLNNSSMFAPFDGVILEKNAQQGELILPTTVIKSLCVLAEMGNLEAEVDIQEREVGRVKVGHPCQVIPDAYPDRVYKAELARVQPQVNRQRGVVPAKVRIIEPDDLLLADMNCRVQFLRRADSTEKVTPTVPSRAISTQDNASVVYILDGNFARQRKVAVGKTITDEVEIVDGLKQGEVVILAGEKPLVDGQNVKVEVLDEKKGAQAQP
ncbi:efflux RND transporter periplasmic adaptor subunit [bacterium]|jgi:HlyD family secretion protein|nr:efflux RND transporter periplasmic adaptor subunit [bacterium]